MEEKEKKIIRKIVMSINREILTFLIIDRKIYYTDRKIGILLRLLPKPRNLLTLIAKSRNRIPAFIAKLFEFKQAELDEYNNAKTVDELAAIVISDGKKNGCILVANGDMGANAELVSKIEAAEVVV